MDHRVVTIVVDYRVFLLVGYLLHEFGSCVRHAFPSKGASGVFVVFILRLLASLSYLYLKIHNCFQLCARFKIYLPTLIIIDIASSESLHSLNQTVSLIRTLKSILIILGLQLMIPYTLQIRISWLFGLRISS